MDLDDVKGVGLVSIGVLVFSIALFLLFSWFFMLIWNAILPVLFSFPVISFWQAAGLKFLLGGIGNIFKSNKKDS
jgi:hypothetical protein